MAERVNDVMLIERSVDHDKFRKELFQHKNKRKSQMGQDQVSRGVSVLCWLAAPVAVFFGNLSKFGNMVIIGNKVQFGDRLKNLIIHKC